LIYQLTITFPVNNYNNYNDKKIMTTAQPSQKKRRIWLYITPLLIIVAALVLLKVFTSMAAKPNKKPMENKPPLVEVLALQQQPIAFSISSQGTVKPSVETLLIPEVSGQIVSVSEKFKNGGYFTQDEVIVAIDDVTYRTNVLQAKSQLESAEASLLEEQAKAEQAKHDWLQTGKPLAEAPILALRKPQLQRAKAAFDAAKASLQQAEIKLARTQIKAPFNGIIKNKQVDIGQYVNMGSPIATIFATDYAEIRLPIKQQDIGFIELPALSQPFNRQVAVDLSLSVNGSSQHWRAYLSRYEGEVDTNSRVHYVVAQLDDPYAMNPDATHSELRVGNFVRATIAGKTLNNVYAIPRKALYGADTIYLVDTKKQLHIQQVAIVHADHDNIYTQDTIADGMRLVLTKLATPVEKMPLRIVGEDEENSSADDSNTAQEGDA
jgi:RND family efflux transporter MFP subunit